MGYWGPGVFENSKACDYKKLLPNINNHSRVSDWIFMQIHNTLNRNSDAWSKDSEDLHGQMLIEDYGVSLSVAAAVVDTLMNGVSHISISHIKNLPLGGESKEYIALVLESHSQLEQALNKKYLEWINSLNLKASDFFDCKSDLIKALEILISKESCFANSWEDKDPDPQWREWREQFEQMIERFKQ